MTEREHKFVVTSAGAQEFIARCNGNIAPTVYDPDNPVAFARTLYLDTRDRAFHRASGMPWACRVRVREYASAASLNDEPRLTGTATIELKQSDGDARRKRRHQWTPAALRALLDGGVCAGDLPFEVPAVCRVAGRLEPQLTTWYRRLSFAAPGVRITVDESVAFCAPQMPGDAGDLAEPERVIVRGPGAVLEVKLAARAPQWLADATAAAGERARFSKFRDGMDLVFGAHAVSRTTLPMPTITDLPGAPK